MVSPIQKIPLYVEGRIVATIDPSFATKNSPFFSVVWSRKAVKRNRPQRPVRAYLTGTPGFMQHILRAVCGGEGSARYGMVKLQELPSGHVLYALSGTKGSN